jgi:HEAT repeat protein
MDAKDLLPKLKCGELRDQVAAAQTLAGMGEDAQAAVVALVESCRSEQDELTQWCVAALEQSGPPAPDEVTRLAELAGDEHALVGYWACTLLGRLGDEAVSATAALALTLDGSTHAEVRQRAAWALGKIGANDEAARRALTRAAESPDPRLARLASEALKK